MGQKVHRKPKQRPSVSNLSERMAELLKLKRRVRMAEAALQHSQQRARSATSSNYCSDRRV
jgi:hypothetical protein